MGLWHIRACLKNHSCNLHAPLCGIFHPNSVAVARYDALIRVKSPANCDAHLAESLFQTRSSSGKDTAKTKGVHREVESEGRWRQNSGLTNRNHMRLWLRIRLRNKPKSNNYSELTVVNVADIWRESDVWYQGRSRQRLETEYENR